MLTALFIFCAVILGVLAVYIDRRADDTGDVIASRFLTVLAGILLLVGFGMAAASHR